MIPKIIQWNCWGLKLNYNDWFLLISNQLPIIICLQETYLKSVDKIKIKNFTWYNYIHGLTDGILGSFNFNQKWFPPPTK